MCFQLKRFCPRVAKAGAVAPLVKLLRDGTPSQKEAACATIGSMCDKYSLLFDSDDDRGSEAEIDQIKSEFSREGGIPPLIKFVKNAKPVLLSGSNGPIKSYGPKIRAAQALYAVASLEANEAAIALEGFDIKELDPFLKIGTEQIPNVGIDRGEDACCVVS